MAYGTNGICPSHAHAHTDISSQTGQLVCKPVVTGEENRESAACVQGGSPAFQHHRVPTLTLAKPRSLSAQPNPRKRFLLPRHIGSVRFRPARRVPRRQPVRWRRRWAETRCPSPRSTWRRPHLPPATDQRSEISQDEEGAKNSDSGHGQLLGRRRGHRAHRLKPHDNSAV